MTHYQAFTVLSAPSIDRKSIDLATNGGVGSNCSPSPLLLKSDEPATVNVRVSGRPRPKVTWFVGTNIIATDERGSPVATPGGEVENHCLFRYSLDVDRVSDNWETDGLTIVASNEVGTDKVKVAVKTYKVLSGMSSSDRKSSRRLRRLLPSYITTDSNSGSGCTSTVTSPSTNSTSKRNEYQKLSWNSEDWTNWHKEMEERSRMRSIDDIIDSDHDNDLDLEHPVIDANQHRSPLYNAVTSRPQTDLDSSLEPCQRSTTTTSDIYNYEDITPSHQTSIVESRRLQSSMFCRPQTDQLQYGSIISYDNCMRSHDVNDRPCADARPAANDPLDKGNVPTRFKQVRELDDDPLWDLHGARLSDVCHRLLINGSFDGGSVAALQPKSRQIEETAIDVVDEVLPSIVSSTTGSSMAIVNPSDIVYERVTSSVDQSCDVLVMSMTYIPETVSCESKIVIAPNDVAVPTPTSVGSRSPINADSTADCVTTPCSKPKPPVPRKPQSPLVMSPATAKSYQQKFIKPTPPPTAPKPALPPKPPIAKKPPIGSRGDKSPNAGASNAAPNIQRPVSGHSSQLTDVDERLSFEHGRPTSISQQRGDSGTSVVVSSGSGSSEVLHIGDLSVCEDRVNDTAVHQSSAIEPTEIILTTVDEVLEADRNPTDDLHGTRPTPPAVDRAQTELIQRKLDELDSYRVTSHRRWHGDDHHFSTLVSCQQKTSDVRHDVEPSSSSPTTPIVRKSEVCRSSSTGSRRPLRSDCVTSPSLHGIATTKSEERLLPVRQGIVSYQQRSPLSGNTLDRDDETLGIRRSSRGKSVDLTASGGYEGLTLPTSVRSGGGSVSSVGRKTISREIVTVTTTEEEVITVVRRPETHSIETASGSDTTAWTEDITSRSPSSVSETEMDIGRQKLMTVTKETDDVVMTKENKIVSRESRSNSSKSDAKSDIVVCRYRETEFDRDSALSKLSLPSRIAVTFEPSSCRLHEPEVGELDPAMMTSSTSSDMLDKLIDTLTEIALAAAADEEDEQRRQQADAAATDEEYVHDGTTTSTAATAERIHHHGRNICARDSSLGTAQTAASY